MDALSDNMLLRLSAVIRDEVTTTDELIPSGETSSYRSNPLRLAEFTLSRRVPSYVQDSKAVQKEEQLRKDGKMDPQTVAFLSKHGASAANTQIVSCIFAKRPGDGSAREQAASCQKVLGGGANICYEYCTKRYRSNCINWGVIPFTIAQGTDFPYETGDRILVKGLRKAMADGAESVEAVALAADGSEQKLTLELKNLAPEERQILLDGCLINYYAREMQN